MTQHRAVTRVAVGVVFSPDGRQVLFGQRPKGKPYEGWWELPGGKLEAGESVEQALVRELEEELGIRATRVLPWAMLEHDYPHAYVRLHFCRVLAFTGQPSSLEKQAFQWAKRDASDLSPLLPATGPVLRWLALPDELLWSQGRVQAGLRVLTQEELRATKCVLTETILCGAFVANLEDLALAARWSLDFTVFCFPPPTLAGETPLQAFNTMLANAHQPMFVHLDIASGEITKEQALLAGAQGLSRVV